jgi:hypothetical protein
MRDVTAELEKIERHLRRNYTNFVLKSRELTDWHHLSSIDPVDKQRKVMEFQILNQEMMKLLARKALYATDHAVSPACFRSTSSFCCQKLIHCRLNFDRIEIEQMSPIVAALPMHVSK